MIGVSDNQWNDNARLWLGNSAGEGNESGGFEGIQRTRSHGIPSAYAAAPDRGVSAGGFSASLGATEKSPNGKIIIDLKR
jgi:hypothetical protein